MAEAKKAVVTGGAGFIGSHVAHALVAKGFEVHVVDTLVKGRREQVPEGAVLHETDIRDTGALRAIFADAQCVFHLAALPEVQYSMEHPDETNAVNADGTLSVLMAAKDAGVSRVVYSASSAAYGDQDEARLSERMAARPKSPYGLQKYIGELYCKLWSEVYGLPTVCLRYFNVYGPRARAEGAYALVTAIFLRQRLAGEALTITGDGTQTRDFVHVDDVARANLLAAESPQVGKGESINIGSGKNASVNDIAKQIGGPVAYVAPRVEPHDTLADITLAKELLGWEPAVTLEEGLAALKKEAGLA